MMTHQRYIFLLFTVSSVLVKESGELLLLNLLMPPFVKEGESANLTCVYDLEYDGLYSLKWYKDDREFYSHVPRLKEAPNRFYDIPGVYVDVDLVIDRTGAFRDLDRNGWIGCKGSERKFGGYPCSLWMLWHTMTVNSLDKKDDVNILDAMTQYVDHFFGCRECARHFLDMVNNGMDVKTNEDSVLWLWKAHNKVNLRLSGDITDDLSFPKEKFPNKQHCSDCYNARVGGSNLWSEFDLKRVMRFLKEMYGKDNISYESLSEKGPREVKGHHDLAVIEHRHEETDRDNFRKETNATTTEGIFSKMDVSLCFSIYTISAVLLIVFYLKFVAKKKLSWILTAFCPRKTSASSNPLLGKV